MNTPPPCAGRWELFDSTDLADHLQAAAICQTCPLIVDCRKELEAAKRDAYVPIKYGPAGTWAGRLVGPKHRISAAKLKAEDGMFTEEELRHGHSRYGQGDRSADARLKERIYQRKRGRRDRSRAAA